MGTFFVSNYIFTQTKQNYLNQSSQTYQRAYNTIHEQYKELSDVVFTGLLKLGNVEEKLYHIERKSKEEQSLIRRSLYFQTIQRFNTLKTKHILNINYILPSNKIFLKMKTPTKFGQLISEKRKTIEYVQKTKRAISSYEIGLFGAGFRFAYPIINQGRYLGILSITFSEKAITSGIMKQYDVLSNFILKDDNFAQGFLEQTKKYQKAHLDGFLHSREVLKDLKDVIKEEISNFKPKKEVSKKIYSKAMRGETNSIYLENRDSIVTTIPVEHLITEKQEGFVSVLSKGDKIADLYKNYLTILSLLIFSYGSVLLIIYQQNIKNILEKENLQKIMQKDKQLFEQAKMAQMGEMIGNIAHQWRQPLSAISTAASGVKLNYEFGLLKQEDIPKYMSTIVDNSKYLSKTIDTFRDFIKEEKIKKEISIQEKVEESINIIQASVENYHIKLIKDIDFEKYMRVTIVGDELVQVIINLINNARDAITQNNIEDGWIKVEVKKLGKKAIITVSDNGGGINEDIISKIFDPYFTTKHQAQGTGLGLYMSKIIVEKHLNGELEVQNENEGARFKIKLNL